MCNGFNFLISSTNKNEDALNVGSKAEDFIFAPPISVILKDFLSSGAKIYSRDTIVFVPKELNLFLTNRSKHRGKYLQGVSYKNGKFVAQISIDSTYTFLGNFDDEITAHNEYVRYKINHAKVLAERWKNYIDIRVYQKLLNFNI